MEMKKKNENFFYIESFDLRTINLNVRWDEMRFEFLFQYLFS